MTFKCVWITRAFFKHIFTCRRRNQSALSSSWLIECPIKLEFRFGLLLLNLSKIVKEIIYILRDRKYWTCYLTFGLSGHLMTNTLWSISCDLPLLTSIRHGVTFQLIQVGSRHMKFLLKHVKVDPYPNITNLGPELFFQTKYIHFVLRMQKKTVLGGSWKKRALYIDDFISKDLNEFHQR